MPASKKCFHINKTHQNIKVGIPTLKCNNWYKVRLESVYKLKSDY